MKKIIPFLAAASAIGIGLFLTTFNKKKPEPTPRIVSDPTLAVASCNQLGFDCYGQFAKTNQGNFVYSPYSIGSALGMLYVGAEGDTAKEIGQVLHHSGQPSELLQSLGGLEQAMVKLNTYPGHEFRSANSLWADQSLILKDDYRNQLAQALGAQVQRVDFNSATAAGKVNDWVAEQTKQQIKQAVNPEQVDGNTRLMLVNACQLKFDWQFQFDERKTRLGYFFPRPKESFQVPMMAGKFEFRHYQGKQFQYLEIPYREQKTAMVIVLPEYDVDLSTIEQQWTAAVYRAADEQAVKMKVDLRLPKFKIQNRLELNDTLGALGMPSAFGAQANFGTLAQEPVFVRRATNETVLEVNESGSEASTVTIIEVAKSAPGMNSPKPDRYVNFHVHRPFLFMVRDNETKAILIMGRVNDPR